MITLDLMGSSLVPMKVCPQATRILKATNKCHAVQISFRYKTSDLLLSVKDVTIGTAFYICTAFVADKVALMTLENFRRRIILTNNALEVNWLHSRHSAHASRLIADK